MKLFSEKNLHRFFDAGILIKAIDSVAEVILGLSLFFLNGQIILNMMGAIFGDEVNEPIFKAIWNFSAHSFAQISNNSQTFLSFIFISHGIIKLILVAGLLKNKLWIYPFAAIAFSGFALYQGYQIFYQPSLLLEALTVLDILFIALIVHEYRYQKKYPGAAAEL